LHDASEYDEPTPKRMIAETKMKMRLWRGRISGSRGEKDEEGETHDSPNSVMTNSCMIGSLFNCLNVPSLRWNKTERTQRTTR
jgi:hypothetical protein